MFLYRMLGEIGMDPMQVGMLGFLTVAAICSVAFGSNKTLKMRVCVPIITAMLGCNLWPLYFQTDIFTTTALAEGQTEKLFIKNK